MHKVKANKDQVYSITQAPADEVPVSMNYEQFKTDFKKFYDPNYSPSSSRVFKESKALNFDEADELVKGISLAPQE